MAAVLSTFWYNAFEILYPLRPWEHRAHREKVSVWFCLCLRFCGPHAWINACVKCSLTEPRSDSLEFSNTSCGAILHDSRGEESPWPIYKESAWYEELVWGIIERLLLYMHESSVGSWIELNTSVSFDLKIYIFLKNASMRMRIINMQMLQHVAAVHQWKDSWILLCWRK